MPFKSIMSAINKQWQQPEKKYPFIMAVASTILVVTSAYLAVVPAIASVVSITALSYGLTLIANYCIKLAKDINDVVKHVDETVINTNKRIVEAKQALANANEVVVQLGNTIKKVDSRVEETKQTLVGINTAVDDVHVTIDQVKETTLPELTVRLKAILEGAMVTLENVNGAAKTFGTYAAPLTYVADAFRGGSSASQGEGDEQIDPEEQMSRQRNRTRPFIGIM